MHGWWWRGLRRRSQREPQGCSWTCRRHRRSRGRCRPQSVLDSSSCSPLFGPWCARHSTGLQTLKRKSSKHSHRNIWALTIIGVFCIGYGILPRPRPFINGLGQSQSMDVQGEKHPLGQPPTALWQLSPFATFWPRCQSSPLVFEVNEKWVR